MTVYLLPLIIVWFGAVALARLDGRRSWVAWIALSALMAAFLISFRNALVIYEFGPQEVVTGGWPRQVGITLRSDSLGITFTALANLLLLVSLFFEYLRGIEERTFPALILFLTAGLNGLFLTYDVFDFYVFFEISMTASYVLSSYGQESKEIRNTFTFTAINLVGSAIFLLSIGALYRLTGTLEMEAVSVFTRSADATTVILVATLLFVAFSIKLGLFPFHFWLPSVYRGVRPVVAAILSGVLANIGSYGLLRFGAGLLKPELQYASNVLLVLGAASIIYGAFIAASREVSSEVLAYSSISQAGYILVALVIGGPLGYAAAVLYSIINSFNKTMLFLTTGMRGWLVGASFFIGALSVAGVPPALGFFGKAAIFRAAVPSFSPFIIASLLFLGSALSFVYMFQIYQKRFWAHPDRESSPMRLRMLVLFLASVLVFFGIWPQFILGVSERAILVLLGGP